MTTTTILSDNGVTSGTSGLKTTGGNDGTLVLQTTTAGGTATTAQTIGTDQVTTFAQAANLPNTFGFKNRIINGAMGISQRGTTFTGVGNVTPTYTIDRWAITTTGAGINVAQVAGIGNYQYAIQLTGTASNTQAYVSQRIESANCYDLAGTTATLQAVMQASSSQTVAWYAYYPTATDNYSSFTAIANGTFSVTTSAQTFSAQISLPSGARNGVWILFYPNNTGAFTSGTLTITGVQLEKGVVATSFDFRSYGTELALCQRYYYRLKAGTSYANAGTGRAYSTTNGQAVVAMPVSMRAAPSSTGYSALSDWNAAGSGSITAMSPAAQYSLDYRQMTIDITMTFGSGQAVILNANNTTNAWIEWSAEL